MGALQSSDEYEEDCARRFVVGHWRYVDCRDWDDDDKSNGSSDSLTR